MKKLLAALIILNAFSALSWAATKTGGDYSISPDALDAGGNSESGSVYSTLSSYGLFVAPGSSAGMDIYSGFMPNLGNRPTVLLTSPFDGFATTYNNINFAWNYDDPDGSAQMAFELQLSTDSLFGIINAGSGVTTSANEFWTADSLAQGSYYWRVKVQNSSCFEWSEWSSAYTLIVDTSMPDTPTVSSLIPHVTSVTVALHTTEDLPPISFRVTYSKSNVFEAAISTTTQWMVGTVNVSTQTLALQKNTTYYFRTQIKDSFGRLSGWSSVYNTSTLCTPPDSVAWGAITDTTAVISWAGDTTGNPADTLYIAQISTTSNFSTTIYATQGLKSGNSVTVTSLTPNTTYYSRVIARNRENKDFITNVSGTRTTLCTAPDGLAYALVTYDQIIVDWTADTTENPSGTRYTAQISSASNFSSILRTVNRLRSDGSATLTSLTPNTTYYVRVIASNWQGTQATTVMPGWKATETNTPAGGTWDSAITNSSIKINWTDPTPVNPNHTPFTVQLGLTPDFSIVAYSSRTISIGHTVTFNDITPNTTYYARILATNWEGVSSTFTLAGWKATLLTEPEGIDWGTVADTTIKVVWTDTSPQNPANTIYKVEMSTHSNFSFIHRSSQTVYSTYGATVESLNPNTTYYARLIATNWRGSSYTIVLSGAKLTKPRAPGAVWGVANTTSLAISWGLDESPLDTPYTVQISTDSEFADAVHTVLTTMGTEGVTFEDLAVNTSYYGRVMVTNWNMETSTTVLSNSKSTYCTTPNAPTVISDNWNEVDGYNAKITIHANGNPPQTEYAIQYDKVALPWTRYNDGDVVTFPDLPSANNRYSFFVRARNHDGAVSGDSPIESMTTPPHVISNFGIVKTISSLSYSWNTVAEADNYNIYSDTLGIIAVNNGAGLTTWTKTGLVPNTTFGIYIDAENSNGTGQMFYFSTYTYAETPGEFFVLSLTSGSISMAVNPAGNSASTQYLIKSIIEETTQYLHTDGTLTSVPEWGTYAQWGGSEGITINDLFASTRYRFSAQAQNGCGELTEFSVDFSTKTMNQFPVVNIVSVATGTINVVINTNANVEDALYAMRISYDGLTKYVQADGTVGDSIVWAGTGTWGGQNQFEVKVTPPSNKRYLFELGCKKPNDETISDFVMETPVYTLPQVPELSFVSISSVSVRIDLSEVDNSSFTVYAMKAIVADGNTYYVQTDKTLGSTLLMRTTSEWQGFEINSLIPNMGYEFSMVAMNGDSLMTDYSPEISTWTVPVTPFAPTVVGGYDEAYGNYVRIFVNAPDSEFTEYAIQWVENGNYLQGDGTVGPGAMWARKSVWERTTTNYNVFKNRTANSDYQIQIKARSPQRGYEMTELSPIGIGTTPPGVPGAPTVTEMEDNDTLRVNYVWTVGGAEKYAIYYSTAALGPYVFISSVSKPDTTFIHDVDGSAPIAPQSCQATPASNSLAITWNNVEAPNFSLPSYYKIAGVNTEEVAGQKSLSSVGNVFVHPRISGYKVYIGTYNVTVSTTARSYVYNDLQPNVTYMYQISACSTDGLESALSEQFYACTLAAVAANPTAVPNWTEAYSYYVSLHYGANSNPAQTKYAVRVEAPNLFGDHWLNNTGGMTTDGPVWTETLSWMHTGLQAKTTYTYYITSLNHAGQQNGAVPVSVETLMLDRPIIGEIQAVSTRTGRSIKQDNETNSVTSEFTWQLVYTSFTVVGYAVSWSTNIADMPGNTIDIPVTHQSGASASYTVATDKDITQNTYFFKVKAFDNMAQVSDVALFVYKYKEDYALPAAAPVAPDGTQNYQGIYYGMPTQLNFKIQFSKDISSDTINAETVYVNSVANSQEQEVAGKLVPQYQYNLDDYSLTITIDLKTNWTYDLVISSNVRDLVDNPMEREYRFKFRTIMLKDSDTGYTIKTAKSPDMMVQVTLPPGALEQDSYLIVNESPIESPRKVSRTTVQQAANKLDNKHIPLWHVEVDRYDAQGKIIDNLLGAVASIVMSYKDDNDDGVVDGSTVRVDTLNIWHLNEERSIWMKLPSVVDRTKKTVRASIKHFSMFMLAGVINSSVADVRCFPVPWVPKGDDVRTGNMTNGITFNNLPQEGEINIYTITGNLVKKIEFRDVMDTGSDAYLQWFGQNTDGQEVASGVYLWIVKSSDGNKKTGKLMIIR